VEQPQSARVVLAQNRLQMSVQAARAPNWRALYVTS